MTLPHDEGGSGPAVVLLHAGIADRSMWAEHLQPLAAAGYRAVAVGLPGFGDVMPAEGEQAPWTDVLQTMDDLSIEQAALVGNSFGGAVALRVALAEGHLAGRGDGARAGRHRRGRRGGRRRLDAARCACRAPRPRVGHAAPHVRVPARRR